MNSVKAGNKLVVFDMDSALLQEPFIDVCAKRLNFYQALTLLRQIDNDPASLASRTASFLTGKNIKDLYEIAAGIPLVEELDLVIDELRARSCIIGIISEGYQSVVEFIGKKIHADFCLANELRQAGDYITGELVIPNYFHRRSENSCIHRICKTNALHYICEKYDIPFQDAIVVGYEDNNTCIVREASMHVCLCASKGVFAESGKRRVAKRSLNDLLMYAT